MFSAKKLILNYYLVVQLFPIWGHYMDDVATKLPLVKRLCHFWVK